jgi:two-component system, OmpR family, phosphate regulon response regulator PhoB
MPSNSHDALRYPAGPALVLVVDDHLDSAEMYAFALDRLNIQSLTAASIEEAYALASERRPDAIVSDLQLSSGSGLDLARRLRADAATRDVAIIMVTGHAASSTAAEAHAAGCDRFLLKPCLPADLATAIMEVLESRQRTAPG